LAGIVIPKGVQLVLTCRKSQPYANGLYLWSHLKVSFMIAGEPSGDKRRGANGRPYQRGADVEFEGIGGFDARLAS
jgi:hypothetical protein